MLKKIDKPLFFIIVTLVISGLVFFGSAALGVLSVNDVKFYAVIKTQLIYALLLGSVALLIGATIPYTLYYRFAYYLFFLGLFVTSLVFVPGLSRYHGGAHRWIDIGPLSLQPSEFLKFAFVVMVAYWCSTYRNSFKDVRYGLLAYGVGLMLVTIILLLQPDFGTYLVIAGASFAVFFVGGARKKHMYILAALGIAGFLLLISVRPYMLERVKTFFDSSQDLHGSSWQVNQSLIALGGGGVFGRGLGQSVQKFNYLPEPIGDSIFAVIGEELGYVGVLYLFSLYLLLTWRIYIIARYAYSQFGRLLVIGILSVILIQLTLNVGSMIGILPLTGVPLPFVSHGGTALIALLFQIGVVLNVSKSSLKE
ncbi:MAG: stage sporulation protein cell division protein FtsW [Candidatus Parcubacteria bacterium]|jgi:cell division protein FtsW